MKTLYLDLVGGASGDMLLGALVDLGLDACALRQALEALDAGPFTLSVSQGKKGAIGGTKLDFEVPRDQPERSLKEIGAIVEGSRLAESVKKSAMAVFGRLAAAEARVHRVSVDEIHFHEVGAMDAILDVTGFVWGLSALGVGRVIASPLPLGRGQTDSMHGRIPLPAPAVLEVLAGRPVVGVDIEAELVTPTGATLVATLAAGFGPLPAMVPERVGYGLGTRDLPFPNVVRAVLGTERAAHGDRVVMLEANIDDLSPQVLGYLSGKLLSAGALDCWLTPVQMKKGRPGVVISVLAPHGLADGLVKEIFAQTTTLGVRVQPVERQVIAREVITVDTPYGPMRVKRAGDSLRPEYDDCVAVADRLSLPLKDVLEEVGRCARSQV